MQVQKEEVRNRILLSSIDEFSRFGFKDASIRRIADAAGVTPGNIYAYFKSKEVLFDSILEQTLISLNAFIFEVSKGQRAESFDIHAVADAITQIFLQHKKQFLILMNGSKGTKYENIKSQLCVMIGNRLKDEYVPMFRADQIDDLSVEAFSIAIIEGFFHIFNQYGLDTEHLLRSTNDFMSLIFNDRA